MNSTPHTHSPRKGLLRGWFPLVVGTCVLAGIARGGEDFSGAFIKSADMSQAYSLTFLGAPGNFPWDGQTSSLNTPFSDLKSNGANYVRLNCWLTTDNNSHMDLTQLKTVALVAKGSYGLKLYVDTIPNDGDSTAGFGGCPSEWLTDYNNATNNGTDFTWTGSTAQHTFADDVKNYYYNIVTALAAQNTPADIVSIGNEINTKFCGVPYETSLYYELVYKGAAGVKLADSSIAVLLHLANIGSNQWQECNKLANCNSLYGTPAIDFDAFGFSFHPEDNPLDNPNWQGSKCVSSNGETIGLKQAFQTENFAQFKNESTGMPDSGKKIYLLVAESSWIWTTSSETVNGTSYQPLHTSLTGQDDPNGEFTSYQYDAYGYYTYLSDECSVVSGMNDGYGKGINDWAGGVIDGWGTTHGDWNMAFWDSATGDLKKKADGTPIVAAFLPAY